MVRHVTDDPVRALTLAWRALPAPLRGWVRLAGPYGSAAALWGAGDRRGALTVLEASPARLAAFSLAVDQPTVARSALARLSAQSSAAPRIAARLAYREGRLTEAIQALSGASSWRSRRLRKTLQAELTCSCCPGGDAPLTSLPAPLAAVVLRDGRFTRRPGDGCCTSSPTRCRRLAPGTPSAPRRSPSPSGRPGWTRTSGPGSASRSPPGRSTAGTVDVDGVPYHRLLPWIMPGRMDRRPAGPAPGRPAGQRAAAGGAARRLQLRQRGHRDRAARRLRRPVRLRGARLLGGHLAVPARGDRRAGDIRAIPPHPCARGTLHELRRPGGDAR